MTSATTTLLERSTPELQGVRSEAILAFLDGLAATPARIHSVMLLRHGRVIAEAWWRPFGPERKRYLYSLSKSFTSTAVGFAVQDGLLALDDRVVSFFPDNLPETVSDNLAAMRVRDLLTMTTGHATDTTPAIFAPGLVNWTQAILALPVQDPPGTHFVYNSGATYLLAVIVQTRTGRTLIDYLSGKLLGPLGIADVTWDACPRGYLVGGWGLAATTEDVARFGQFCLQRGMWKGVQLIPAAWIDEATAKQVPNDGEDRVLEPIDWKQGYGYQFWRCQHDAYRGDGAFGQYCVVMPGQDAVLALTSETANMQVVLDQVWAHLVPALEGDGPLPTSPTAQQLKERLSHLQIAPPSGLSSTTVLGKGGVFSADPNQSGIHTIAVEIDPEGCVLRVVNEGGEHAVRCGFGRWVDNQTTMPFLIPTMIKLFSAPTLQAPVPLAGAATWSDPQTLTLIWQYLETPHQVTVTCHFDGDALSLQIQHSVAEPDNPFLSIRDTRLLGKAA